MATQDRYRYSYISTATTTLVKSGGGRIHSVVVGETAAGTITLYDGLTAGGTVFAVLKASIAEGDYLLDVEFNTGLTVVTAAASKLTVTFI